MICRHSVPFNPGTAAGPDRSTALLSGGVYPPCPQFHLCRSAHSVVLMQLIPVMNKIIAGLRGVKQISADTPELQKLLAWMGKLQNRSINEGITEDENRELGFVAQSTLDRLKASVM